MRGGHRRPSHALHSTYFEVLGEHGFPGIVMFLTLAITTFLMLRRLARNARKHPELQWVVGLADALQSGLAVFLSAGAFVGLAFQPMFWYFISMSICLNAYVWRVERQQTQTETGWRAGVNPGAAKLGVAPAGSDWRGRRADAGLGTAVVPRR